MEALEQVFGNGDSKNVGKRKYEARLRRPREQPLFCYFGQGSDPYNPWEEWNESEEC